MNPNLKYIFFFGGGGGEEARLANFSYKESESKKTFFWGWGGEGGEGARV